MSKNVLIPKKLFYRIDLLMLYLCEHAQYIQENDGFLYNLFEAVRKEVDFKIESMERHTQFTKVKTSASEAERKEALEEYKELLGHRIAKERFLKKNIESD